MGLWVRPRKCATRKTARRSPTSRWPPARLRPEGSARRVVSKERAEHCPQGWKESLNGRNWELTTWFRISVWRALATACNEYLEKGSQVYVRGELRGEAVEGTQNPRIWVGQDGESRASYEITARTVKMFLGRRDNGNGAPIGEPPVGGEDEDVLPF